MATNRFADVESIERAPRQRITLPTYAFTTSEANFTALTLFDLSTTCPGTTTAGVLVNDSNAIFSPCPDLGGSMYLTELNFTARETSAWPTIALMDMLWACAVDISVNNGSTVDVSGIDFSGRLPKKPDDATPCYTGLELYAVNVANATGLTVNPTLTVGYTDGAGNSKTSSVTINTTFRGRAFTFPLDTDGIQAINNYQVTGGTVTSGNVRIILVRHLTMFPTFTHVQLNFMDLGMVQVFPNSAFVTAVWDPTGQGVIGPAARGYNITLRAA
jgi:hypothetical protein